MERLTEEDYRKYVESMHKRCKLVTGVIIGFWVWPGTKSVPISRRSTKTKDLTQQVSSRAYFEAFMDKPRIRNSKMLRLCRDYSEISKELMEKGKLDKYTQLRWFLQDLPSSIQSRLFYFMFYSCLTSICNLMFMTDLSLPPLFIPITTTLT